MGTITDLWYLKVNVKRMLTYVNQDKQVTYIHDLQSLDNAVLYKV